MNERERLTALLEQNPWLDVMHIENYAWAAGHLLANGVTVQRWIPVTDPPEKDGIYLVMGADGLPYVESYGDIFGNGNRVWTRRNTTHWMPLPPPPKEEE